MRPSLQGGLRHPVSIFGIVLTSAMAGLFFVLLLLDWFAFVQNPYFGLLLFVAVPAAFVVALALIPFGSWLAARRGRRSPDGSAVDWPVYDLRVARQRGIIAVIVSLTIVNLMVLSVASYGAVHYMETTQFC